MEITVSKTALSDKLKSVGRIIQPKNSLPAYDNFLFVIDEFGVILVTAGEEGGRIYKHRWYRRLHQLHFHG